MTEIANLTSAQISKIAKLIKEKENLQAKIDKIDAELAQSGATSAPKRRGRKPGRKPGRKATGKSGGTRKRGAVKEKILDLLKKSGAEGISVQEIAGKIKSPVRNVHSWFQTTGKKLPGITKVGRAKYTLK